MNEEPLSRSVTPDAYSGLVEDVINRSGGRTWLHGHATEAEGARVVVARLVSCIEVRRREFEEHASAPIGVPHWYRELDDARRDEGTPEPLRDACREALEYVNRQRIAHMNHVTVAANTREELKLLRAENAEYATGILRLAQRLGVEVAPDHG